MKIDEKDEKNTENELILRIKLYIWLNFVSFIVQKYLLFLNHLINPNPKKNVSRRLLGLA